MATSTIDRHIVRQRASFGRIERTKHLNGFQKGVVLLMRFEGQCVQKLRRELADIAVMGVEEVKIAVWTPERVGFLNCHLQVGARNILVDRLTQIVIGHRIIKDQVADRLQQLAVRFRRLSDRSLVILQGFSGLLMTRCDAGLDHGVGHFRSLSITRRRHWLTYHFIATSYEGLCLVF